MAILEVWGWEDGWRGGGLMWENSGGGRMVGGVEG